MGEETTGATKPQEQGSRKHGECWVGSSLLRGATGAGGEKRPVPLATSSSPNPPQGQAGGLTAPGGRSSAALLRLPPGGNPELRGRESSGRKQIQPGCPPCTSAAAALPSARGWVRRDERPAAGRCLDQRCPGP